MSKKPKWSPDPERDARLAEATDQIRRIMDPRFDARAYHIEEAKRYRAKAAAARERLGEELRSVRAKMTDGQWQALLDDAELTAVQAEAYMNGQPAPGDSSGAPEALARPTRPTPAPRQIYFIQSVGGGPIKIGVSDDPRRRLADLQVGSPAVLRLIGTAAGDQRREAALHRRLAEHRLHGEWFTDAPEVFAAIAEVLS